eukprot:CAMPEP_0175333112 /NCGR_PEP_ID=MMETSP0095-20121207/2115_1 /TAXON_ID=311494 /ORGANISM="Alexandrium monilatum, Strain CCMP3105" /LENGTH=497 /DNA_ID=CAMNT_0016630401 /DNA_START=3 /DNA_END=1492 /DNA_ORIENTATION=+
MRRSSSRSEISLEHEDEVMALAFSPDGHSLIAGGEDSMAVLWDVDRQTRLLEAPAGGPVLSASFAPCGEHFAVGTTEGDVLLWLARERKQVGTARLKGEILSLAFSTLPADLLAAGTTAQNVVLLSIPDLQDLAEFQHHGQVRSISFSPSNGFLAGGGGGIEDVHGLMKRKERGREMKTYLVWQVSPKADECKYLGSITFDNIVHVTAFSPTGRLLAVGGENCIVAVLLVDRNFEQASELLCPAGVRTLAWTPDSRFLATAGEDMQISLWDVLSEEIAFQLPKALDWYCSIAFTTDCRWLAACGFGSNAVTLHPLDLLSKDKDENEGKTDLAAETPRPRSSLTRPWNQELVKSKGTVKLLPAIHFDSEDFGLGVVHADSEGFRIKVERVGVASESTSLTSRTHERKSQASLLLGVPLLPLRLGRCKSREPVSLEHQDDVFTLALSPDGERLVAAGEDGCVVVWDVCTRSRIMAPSLGSRVVAVAYSPGGAHVAAGAA